ncbi:chlorophyll a/b-binding protein domain-containing protein, partial [Pavlovales sp. CCMP2436]
DPLGLSSSFDLKWLREAELKHSRLAMLATVGFVATDLGMLAPGAPAGFSSIAAHDMAVDKGAMFVLLFAASVIEICAGVPAVEQMMKGGDRAPGDFSFDPLGFSKAEPAAKKLAVNELKNGRLAMLAFSGMITQSVLTGHGFPYMS